MLVYSIKSFKCHCKSIFVNFLVTIILLGSVVLSEDSMVNASTDEQCNWNIKVLGEFVVENSVGSPLAHKNNLVVGITYRTVNTNNRFFYGFVTNDHNNLSNEFLVNQITGNNARPLRAVKLDSELEENTYGFEGSRELPQNINLVASKVEIVSLEKLDARITPQLSNKNFIRRGGSDFSGPLSNRAKGIKNITKVALARSPVNNIHICSYVLN